MVCWRWRRRGLLEPAGQPEPAHRGAAEEQRAGVERQRALRQPAVGDQGAVVGERRREAAGLAGDRVDRLRRAGAAGDLLDARDDVLGVAGDRLVGAERAQLLGLLGPAHDVDRAEPARPRELQDHPAEGAAGGVLDEPLAGPDVQLLHQHHPGGQRVHHELGGGEVRDAVRHRHQAGGRRGHPLLPGAGADPQPTTVWPTAHRSTPAPSASISPMPSRPGSRRQLRKLPVAPSHHRQVGRVDRARCRRSSTSPGPGAGSARTRCQHLGRAEGREADCPGLAHGASSGASWITSSVDSSVVLKVISSPGSRRRTRPPRRCASGRRLADLDPAAADEVDRDRPRLVGRDEALADAAGDAAHGERTRRGGRERGLAGEVLAARASESPPPVRRSPAAPKAAPISSATKPMPSAARWLIMRAGPRGSSRAGRRPRSGDSPPAPAGTPLSLIRPPDRVLTGS